MPVSSAASELAFLFAPDATVPKADAMQASRPRGIPAQEAPYSDQRAGIPFEEPPMRLRGRGIPAGS